MKYTFPFIYGLLAAAISLMLESFSLIILFPNKMLPNANSENTSVDMLFMVALAVLIEESFKLIFIRKIYLTLENKQKIVLFSFLLGIGFSLIEVGLNLFQGEFWQKNLLNPYLWGVAMIHIITSLIIGYLFSLSKREKGWFLIAIFLAAFIVHLSYNFLIIFLFK